MAKPLKPNPLIAVDTNVPLDLAEEKDHAMDALAVIRRRLKPGRVLVSSTVFQELVFLADNAETPEQRKRARLALRSLAGWGLVKGFDVEMPAIATPREIVARFD